MEQICFNLQLAAPVMQTLRPFDQLDAWAIEAGRSHAMTFFCIIVCLGVQVSVTDQHLLIRPCHEVRILIWLVLV